MKLKNFLALTVGIGVLFALLIYWRQVGVRDQVSLIHVVLWQIGIWLPWTLGFMVFAKLMKTSYAEKHLWPTLLVASVLWVGLHYGWFYWVSLHYSPYLGMPETKCGVYAYFFIFWTLVDLGLMWFVIDRLSTQTVAPPLLFELTRGGNKYFCDPTQIQLLASENYYTKLYTTEGIFVMRKPLKSFYEVLPSEMFKKIHRSTIINVNFVAELARGNGQNLEVIMKDGTRRRVSRNFIKEINLYFKNRTY